MSRYRQVDNLPIIYIMSSNGYPNVPPSACPLALPTWIPLHSSSVHHVAVASVRTSVTHAAPAHAHPVDTGLNRRNMRSKFSALLISGQSARCRNSRFCTVLRMP